MCKGEFTLIFSSRLILCALVLIVQKLLLQEDIYCPKPWIQDMLWDSLYVLTEPFLNRWPLNKFVREKALQVTMKHIHYEDEISRFITVGVVEKVMSF